MRVIRFIICGGLCAGIAAAQGLNCDMKGYKAQEGLTAVMRDGVLELQWTGERGEQLRAGFTVRDARKAGGGWVELGRDLTPEFHVTSGKRRLSGQQVPPLRQLGICTPEVIERKSGMCFGTRR